MQAGPGAAGQGHLLLPARDRVAVRHVDPLAARLGGQGEAVVQNEPGLAHVDVPAAAHVAVGRQGCLGGRGLPPLPLRVHLSHYGLVG